MTKNDLIQLWKDSCDDPKNNFEKGSQLQWQMNRSVWELYDANMNRIRIQCSGSGPVSHRGKIEIFRTIGYCKINNCEGYCSFTLSFSEYRQLAEKFSLATSGSSFPIK